MVSLWFYNGCFWVRDGQFRVFLMDLMILRKIVVLVWFFRFYYFGYFFLLRMNDLWIP